MYPRSLVHAEKFPLGVTVIFLDSFFLALAAVALGIRIMSRKIQGHQLCLNDHTALLARPCAAGVLTTAILGKSPKGYLAALVGWSAANTAIKVSILHFYITIFGSNKAFRYITYATTALPITFGIGKTLTAILLCRPFAKNWDPLLPGVYGSTIGAFLATSIVNLIVDLIVIILPMPMIWRLQMAPWRKIALIIIFGLGFIVCIITALRIILGAQSQIDDFTHDLAKLAIVSDLEPLLGITTACLPLFPPAFKKVFGAKEKPESRNMLLSSLARLRSKNTKNFAFRRFDDAYPLTDIEGSRTENQTTGLGSNSSSLRDDSGRNMGSETYFPPAIKVKQGWEVRSDKVV